MEVVVRTDGIDGEVWSERGRVHDERDDVKKMIKENKSEKKIQNYFYNIIINFFLCVVMF
jgi:hypothetical protein